MRGTFSSNKIFFKPYYHNSSVAVDITMISDIGFKWKFLVCENNILPDIPCLFNLPNQLMQQNFKELCIAISEINVCEGNVDFHEVLEKT